MTKVNILYKNGKEDSFEVHTVNADMDYDIQRELSHDTVIFYTTTRESYIIKSDSISRIKIERDEVK